MSKTFRYRLFKVGALPEELRAEIQNDEVLFLEEGIPVTVRRSGTAPGFRGGGIGRFSGAFAVTKQRIVANISKTVVVNVSSGAKDTNGAELSISQDGLYSQ